MNSISKFIALTLLMLIVTSSAQAETLLNQNGVVITVNQEQSDLDLNIKGVKYTQSSVFKLRQPARIVVDLKGKFSEIKRSFTLNQDPEFKEVRIATHPDKLRIVLELSTPDVPEYRYTNTSGNFILKASRSVLASVNQASASPPRAMLKPDRETGDYLVPQVEDLREDSQNSGPSLIDLIFIDSANSEDLGALRVALSQRDSFTLLRIDPKEYKLILSNTIESGIRTNLPYFPPQNLKGITVATPTIENGKVVINMGTDRGFRLRATGSGNDIIIRPQQSN
ncbi:MAG: AMIN domain-containing protein [Bdellovibrionota bacterium]